MNITLQKKSQLAITSPHVSIAEYERFLNAEGLTGGYHPVSGLNISLAECLADRVPNLYFLRYGGLEDLVAGGEVITDLGRRFRIKTAPRSATGPDLRRLILGSQGSFGKFEEVVLRVFSMPAAEQWGLVLVEKREEAFRVLRLLVAHFLRPLFAKILDEEESAGLLKSLNLFEVDRYVVAVKFVGLKKMVDASRTALTHLLDGTGASFYWPVKTPEMEILDGTLMTPDAFESLLKVAGPLLHFNKENASRSEIELKKYLEEHTC